MMINFILSFFSTYIILFTTFLCITKVLKKSINIKKKILIIIFIFTILFLINSLYAPENLRLLYSLLLNTIYLKILFNLKISDSVIYSIIDFIIEIIIEILVGIIVVLCVRLLYINNIKIDSSTIYFKTIITLFESSLLYLIFSLKNFIKLVDNIKIILTNKKNIGLILTILTLFLNIIVIIIYKEINNIHVIILSLSSIVFTIVSFIEIIKDKYNINKLKLLNDNNNLSLKAYSKTIEECREMKHNVKNELYSIKSLLPKKDQIKVNNLIKKYNQDYEWISTIGDIPEGLQGLIYLKQLEAKKKNILIEINSKQNLQIEEKDYFDLSTFLGILIDNAIDASITSKSKIIYIDIYSNRNILNIEIINKFNNNINVNEIGDKKYSTKDIPSGIGLNYIKTKNNKKIKLKQKIVNDLFITNIIYKIKTL